MLYMTAVAITQKTTGIKNKNIVLQTVSKQGTAVNVRFAVEPTMGDSSEGAVIGEYYAHGSLATLVPGQLEPRSPQQV